MRNVDSSGQNYFFFESVSSLAAGNGENRAKSWSRINDLHEGADGKRRQANGLSNATFLSPPFYALLCNMRSASSLRLHSSLFLLSLGRKKSSLILKGVASSSSYSTVYFPSKIGMEMPLKRTNK